MGRGKEQNLVIALLLNAFALPGSGHVAAGMKRRGLIIAALALTPVMMAIARVLSEYRSALDRIPLTGLNLGSILSALQSAWMLQESYVLKCLIALLAVWAIGIIDLLWRARSRFTHASKNTEA